jgi:hypothetical protein
MQYTGRNMCPWRVDRWRLVNSRHFLEVKPASLSLLPGLRGVGRQIFEKNSAKLKKILHFYITTFAQLKMINKHKHGLS